MSPETEYQRRRYTLTFQGGRSGERGESVLTEVSSRLRGDLLRNLIITGLGPSARRHRNCRACWPVCRYRPPRSVSCALIQQMASTAGVSRAAAAVPVTPANLPCLCPGQIPGN